MGPLTFIMKSFRDRPSNRPCINDVHNTEATSGVFRKQQRLIHYTLREMIKYIL